MKKATLFLLLAVVIFLAGCETTKGMVTGMAKDATNTWAALSKADEWMRENLW